MFTISFLIIFGRHYTLYKFKPLDYYWIYTFFNLFLEYNKQRVLVDWKRRAITVSPRWIHIMCFILGKPEHVPVEFWIKEYFFSLLKRSTNRANNTDTFVSSSYGDILSNLAYNPDYPTYLFIHGLNQTQNGITVTLLVAAFAERGGNNFVALEWPAGSVLGSLLQVLLVYLNSYITVMKVSIASDFISYRSMKACAVCRFRWAERLALTYTTHVQVTNCRMW